MTAVRSDLTYLRRRSRSGLASAPASTAGRTTALSDYLASQTRRVSEQAPVAVSVPMPAQPSAPAPVATLDPFDLSLDAPVQATSEPVDAAPAPTRRKVRQRAALSTLEGFPRLGAGERLLMGKGSAPVVALSRLQSGTGILSVTTVGLGIGLGCFFETVDGPAQVAEYVGADPQVPVAIGRGGQVLVNLRQVHRLRRFLVYGQDTHASGRSGALVVQTLSAARMELEVETSTSTGTLGMMSGHNVDGMLVLRQEHPSPSRDLRSLSESFGYSLTWVDSHTPLTTYSRP